MVNYTKKTFYDTSVIFIFLILAAVAAYLFRLILSKNLNLADFGLFSALLAFAGILAPIKDMGIPFSAVYYIPRLVAKKKWNTIRLLVFKIFRFEVYSSFLVVIFLIVFSKLLSERLFHGGDVYILFIFGLSFFFDSLELTILTFFNSFQKQFLYALHNLSKVMLLCAVAFVMFLFFKSIYSPLISLVFVYMTILVVFGFIFFRKILPKKEKSRESIHIYSFSEMFKLGFPSMLIGLGFFLIVNVDTLVLSYFRTLDEVGLYSAAILIISLIVYLPSAINSVILPLSSELYVKKKNILKLAIENIIKYVLIVLVPVTASLYIYSTVALETIFGSKFIGASVALSVLSIGSLFYSMANINMSFINGTVGPKKSVYIIIAVAVANIISTILLIPAFGIVGAAIAVVIGYIIMYVLSVITLYRNVKLRFNYMYYILILVSGFVFVLIVNYLKTIIFINIYLEIALISLIAGIAYLGLLFLFGILTLSEIKEVVNQILRK